MDHGEVIAIVSLLPLQLFFVFLFVGFDLFWCLFGQLLRRTNIPALLNLLFLYLFARRRLICSCEAHCRSCCRFEWITVCVDYCSDAILGGIFFFWLRFLFERWLSFGSLIIDRKLSGIEPPMLFLWTIIICWLIIFGFNISSFYWFVFLVFLFEEGDYFLHFLQQQSSNFEDKFQDLYKTSEKNNSYHDQSASL